MSRTTLGILLHSADRESVKRVFVHRFTRDNVPQWAQGTNYKPQFADDQDWLCHSYFHVRKDGRLDERYTACRSEPTWPDGKGAWGQKGIDY